MLDCIDLTIQRTKTARASELVLLYTSYLNGCSIRSPSKGNIGRCTERVRNMDIIRGGKAEGGRVHFRFFQLPYSDYNATPLHWP
jgi:hypothetical protein